MCLFIKQFFSNPISTGAVHPSSDELANLITETAELKKRSTIVEIGSGTGVFTEKICEKKDENADFFVIELNPLFVKQTIKRCPYVKVFEGSAENINNYLTNLGYSGCECIISGLPWASFDNEIQDSILKSLYDAMVPGAVFLTFSYLPSLIMPSGRRFRKKLTDMFGSVQKTKVIWKNIPPAFVYSVYKPEVLS
jgi:phospholipid N-methyltransferase